MFTTFQTGMTRNRFFCENTISLNELIGNVELEDFHEIWPGYFLNIEEQKCVAILYILNIYLLTAPNARRSANYSML